MANSKKEPGIFQRGARWQIDTFYQGHRLRASFATLPAARKNLNKLRSLIDEGRYLDKKREPKETLSELMERYLKWCEGMREKAYASKAHRIRLVVNRLGAETPIAKLRRADIEKYQADRLNSPGERKTAISKATVNREIAALKHLLSKAVEWQLLDDSPARGLKMFKESGRRVRHLTTAEIQRLLMACSQTLSRIVMLALHTGMRKGEILHLTWDNVNLSKKYIELVDQKNGEHSIIHLNPQAFEALRSVPRRLGSDYVFAGKVPGKPLFDLKRQFESAVAKAKLEDVTFHTLRHTFASHRVMAGVDLATVKELLRHKSIDMTLRYSHLSPAHKESAVDALVSAYAQADHGAVQNA